VEKSLIYKWFIDQLDKNHSPRDKKVITDYILNGGKKQKDPVTGEFMEFNCKVTTSFGVETP